MNVIWLYNDHHGMIWLFIYQQGCFIILMMMRALSLIYPLTGTSPLPFGTHPGSPRPSPERRLIKTPTQVACFITSCDILLQFGPFRPLCFKFEPPWSIWTIWAILGHSVPIWQFWVISDDDDDCAGDPWQQYMAAQMAVGGGYSPHMYSHRLVTFFTLFLLMLVSFFLMSHRLAAFSSSFLVYWFLSFFLIGWLLFVLLS